MAGLFSKFLGDPNERFLKNLQPLVEEINRLEKKTEGLTNNELKSKTEDFKEFLAKGGLVEDILPEVFSVVREAAKRNLNQRHFDAQILGGIVLHQGKIAEMKTGEGKTLTSTLPVYLNALEGKGVHVVTVNDYLSRRDAVWMGQIYHFLGLSVSCINHDSSYIYDPSFAKEEPQENEIFNFQFPISKQISNSNDQNRLDKIRDTLGSFKVVHEFLKPCSRKEAYAADITYGTNNEFAFDYLRDNMAYQKEQVVQREWHYAIVDEIDSILIDEARTPLIISVPDEESAELYKTFASIVPRLNAEEHYSVDEKQKAVSLTEEGIERVEKLLGIGDIYTEKGMKYVHHLNQALRAHVIFRRDKDYVVRNGEVIIIDEFTGRMMPGRRWSEGLHQAIEAKEGVDIQKESRTLASVTFQNYFKLYKKLSGMTGTALTSAEEFDKVYGLEVVVVPTNKPMIREDNSDLVYAAEEGKIKAVVEEIKERHKKGQPVLVGTVSIDKNEYLSALLKKEGVAHRLLNAKHHEEEGEIIAQAGKKGMVTVATNMAGRGVDIVLGGNPSSADEANDVCSAGGLYVLGTERHEARRIDDQLRGRSGRQGDPGESRFFVSLEDDLMRIFGSDKIKNMMRTLKIPEDQPIENKMITRAIGSAQAKIEGMNFDIRKHLLEYDNVLNKQRGKIYGLRRKALFANKDELGEIITGFFDHAGEDISKLSEKEREFGKEDFANAERNLLLRVIDMLWTDHLEAMDYMRSSVNLRAYGQRDPLIEYKNEGARMFKQMEDSMGDTFVKLILNVQKTQGMKNEESTFRNSKLEIRNSRPKVGRNAPCPCGSGKKYKKCCGK
ncbi:MAG: preprotein translocase subunit SecA [Candidatus Tagabacteria bacterium CG09_land_8_20_14_0_10_41_14]|uniref:Protein translocase subunit SecA n=2 Tax=Candidatus Tagaibacteriota TaxID=1817918 RepID=A0A2H0WLA9_9BACT|nr:MAG: preprotein translocase subunit SecA [Candidatus Tagabacteria bacterium CG09_land_8_20_14_0_10_41_14]PJE73088.1 MAG: preprotein translocase subunit SecA [Candidatus Tagabacteria bacterium CG10_big_fil_rev_8_21_14_0_10_40_13]